MTRVYEYWKWLIGYYLERVLHRMIIRYKWLITSRILWLHPLSLSFISYILPHKYSTRYKVKGHIVKFYT